MTLNDLGWNKKWEREFAPYAKRKLIPARLNSESTDCYGAFAIDPSGKLQDLTVILSGKVWHEAKDDADLPAIGDWVALELGAKDEDHIIRARLSRRSRFSRKTPGKSVQEQVIAANVDVVCVVTDPGADYNPRRLERYFTLITRSGAKPLLLVNKSDAYAAEQCDSVLDELQELFPGIGIHLVSALDGSGLSALHRYLEKGTTLCLVGSSGVGKSTLINQILEKEAQDTGEVNEVTGRGRHTTIARKLIPLPQGGLLIDNPGIREVQMWTDEATLRESFADFDALARQCKFSDCQHGSDQGCAIRQALKDGEISPDRLQNYLLLDEEIAELQRRAKKRRIASERWAKRNHRVRARNLEDRIELEREERAEWR